MILEIKVEERSLEFSSGKIKKEHNEYTRISDGDLTSIALEHIRDADIEDYARCTLGLVDEDDVPEATADDLDTLALIYALKERGYEVIKCQTLADTDKFNQIKETLNL